uniref:Metalloendopeptidase n=1 Tax=Spirinchus lanceolatus TaxID=136040 RepID=E2RWN0_9TELE|nr:hatching enzyme [Spirinchus lanceolatus]
MDHRFVSAVLVLLLGLTQVSLQKVDVAADVSTLIIEANKGMNHVLLEGDVALPKTRNAMKCLSQQCKWPKSASGLVEVPYKIATVYQSNDVDTIKRAMNGFATQTCIRFVPYAGQKNYLDIKSNGGCWSNLGRQQGSQPVSLDTSGCINNGVIQHELLHALGFYHEHTRSDRDQYVRVNFANVRSEYTEAFQKQDTNNQNTPYDYSSVMHYGRNAFAQGGETITPIPDSSVAIGQRAGMAKIDIQRVNKLYECRA